MSLTSRYRALRARRWQRWVLDGLLFALAVWAVSRFQARHLLSSGVAAPVTELVRLDGTQVSLESLKGKPVALTFWAPWCGVCGAESDNLSRVQRLVGDKAHVVSVAVGYQQVGQVRDFMQRHGAEYPVWLGGEQTMEAWKVNQFPTTYFLSAEGTVKGSVVGYTTTAGLLSRLWW